MVKKLSERFAELVAQAASVESTAQTKSGGMFGDSTHVDAGALLNWKVKASSLIERACGKDSEYLRRFRESEGSRLVGQTNHDEFERLKAVFLAAQEDFDGGHLHALRLLVQAELFDSELEQAEELLLAGYVGAAAVIAGVVLETTLREMCSRHSLPTGKLDRMNADLAKSGAYDVLTQKKVTAWAHMRNLAAHGKQSDFRPDDVKSMMADVRRFLSDHCGP
jgi:hypothetical protein